jgi:hypothetical protein
MARRTLRRVFADVLHGDVVRAPSEADNAEALKAQGWEWRGVTFEQQDAARAARARQQEPSPHVQSMERRGFRQLNGPAASPEDRARQMHQIMEIERKTGQ